MRYTSPGYGLRVNGSLDIHAEGIYASLRKRCNYADDEH